MIDLSTLSVFVVAVLVLLLSPGPNMAFVISQGVAHGVQGGLAAALGILVADIVLTILTAVGVTAVVAAWPPAFDILRYGGAIYLLYLAFKAIHSPSSLAAESTKLPSKLRIFRASMLGSLINPKALLFFLVFLPQFVVVSKGHVALQLAVLGLVLSIEALLFHMLLGALGGSLGQWLARRPVAAKVQSWVLGSVMGALALRLLLLDRPAKV